MNTYEKQRVEEIYGKDYKRTDVPAYLRRQREIKELAQETIEAITGETIEDMGLEEEAEANDARIKEWKLSGKK